MSLTFLGNRIKKQQHRILFDNSDLRKCKTITLVRALRKHTPKRAQLPIHFVLHQENASGGTLTTATAYGLAYRQFLKF